MPHSYSRRQLLAALAIPRPRIAKWELIPVHATPRTTWLIVQLTAADGRIGLGEASDAFGVRATTPADEATMRQELTRLNLNGKNPPPANLLQATAQSALEQARWDIAAQQRGVPIHQLLGKQVRQTIPVYANINRTTKPRTPDGFAQTAKRAVAEGFRAVKLAPFDGFPSLTASAREIEAAAALGIDCIAAVRQAVGPAISVMVDCHSYFDVPLAVQVAKRLEPYKLTWYEEPVPPERTAETVAIRKQLQQPMAGGEILYAVKGFQPLCETQAVNVIMPDVKHCGGLAELIKIGRMAARYKVDVAPHNPSGPVATAATLHACAVIPNCPWLELQWGEVAWRGSLLHPPELFQNGEIAISTAPGLGARLNRSAISES